MIQPSPYSTPPTGAMTRPQPKRHPWFVRWGLPFVVVFGGIGGYLLLMFLKPETPPVPSDDNLAEAEVFLAEAYPDPIAINSTGFVRPFREFSISSQIPGTVLKKYAACEAGRFVKANTPLIDIDPREFELEVQRLEQEVEQAKIQASQQAIEIANMSKQIERSREQLEIVRTTLNRYLQSGNEGIYSQTDIDSARLQELSSRDQFESQQEQLEVLKAQQQQLLKATELAETRLAMAQLDLSRCSITAPCDGVVVEEQIEENSYVAPGTTLLMFEDTSKVEIECDLLVEEMVEVLANASAALGPYELPNNNTVVTFQTHDRTYEWSGRLARLNGVGLDDRTRTVPCIVEVDKPVRETGNGWKSLVRGMFVALKIEIEPLTKPLAFPSVAQQTPGKIWLIRDGKLESAEIEIMEAFDPDKLESMATQPLVLAKPVENKLLAGTQVVTSPLPYAYEGQAVEVIPSSGESPKEKPDESTPASKDGKGE